MKESVPGRMRGKPARDGDPERIGLQTEWIKNLEEI
jgi:hypothetical protein